MKNINILFFKEFVNNTFRQLNIFVFLISVVIFTFLFLNLYRVSLKFNINFLFFFIFIQYFVLFIISFLREIYLNPSNRLLLLQPVNENNILFKRVFTHTFIFLIVLFIINSTILFRQGMDFSNFVYMLLIIVSSFSTAYFFAYFINNIIFIFSVSILILLMIKNLSIFNMLISRTICIMVMMSSTIFLFSLKFCKKLKPSKTFFDKYYVKIINSIFTFSHTISKFFPKKMRIFIIKDFYYLFSNILTLFSLLLNIFFFIILFLLHFKATLPVTKVILIAYILNIFLYSEKLLSIFAGIEKNGIILLKIFPPSYKRIFLSKLAINILFMVLTGIVNLICVFHFFCMFPPKLSVFLKYIPFMIITGFLFTLISYFMHKLSNYESGLNDFSFNAMLFEQAPVYGKEFIGLLLAIIVVIISSGMIYFLNIF